MQVTNDHCLSIFYGSWPWSVWHLINAQPPVIATWLKDLSVLVEACKSYLSSRGRDFQSKVIPIRPNDGLDFYDNPQLNYSLKCRYTDLYRQHLGSVSALVAVEQFLGSSHWLTRQVQETCLLTNLIVFKRYILVQVFLLLHSTEVSDLINCLFVCLFVH